MPPKRRQAQAFTGCLPPFAMVRRQGRESRAMVGLALMMFLGLFAFGAQLLGWSDPNGQVQLGIFMSFIFGTICGYKTRS
jgi:hypothetical protein